MNYPNLLSPLPKACNSFPASTTSGSATTGCTSASARSGRGRSCLTVDNIVVCAGQEPVRELEDELRRGGIRPHVIGGAAVAAELDAERAIRQGTELAARL